MSVVPEESWERRLGYLPLGLLAVAAVVALVTGPGTGATSPSSRLAAQLVLLALTTGWLLWWLHRKPTVLSYAVRGLLALALTLLNPLFCIFAWIGFADAVEVFPKRGLWLGVGATAVTMALGQSGGAPWRSAPLAVLFLLLLLVNFLLAYLMGRYSVHAERTSIERKAAIIELERVNASLERALAENTALHETVVAQARAAGVQEERQRLAREIHDTIAQALAGVVAQLQAAREEEDPATGRRRVDRAAALARDALVEARRSMLDLVPAPLAESSLADAVAVLVEDWVAHRPADPPVAADAVVTGEVRPLHPELEATVLRIAQEALSNVAKHADARRVAVTLSYLDDEVMLDVRDDGTGFDPGTPSGPTSFGLRGMRQRAERLAGVLDVETEPGGGTVVSVRLPALERGAA
ncbi:sensor histidine kinase [Nocardioides sp. LHD-245]|uniref:sensor histidine kinase n=1 Tax=Nocardioides sp. LHD-245 TaxID=3051387 RepID=UPI0027DF7CCF|nr:sensor histidine kinase [Nocardioides sp. LHD-245]